MFVEILLALTIPPLLLLGWVVVQSAWRRHFFISDVEGDVLAGRGNCGNCGCATPCDSDEDQRTNRRS